MLTRRDWLKRTGGAIFSALVLPFVPKPKTILITPAMQSALSRSTIGLFNPPKELSEAYFNDSYLKPAVKAWWDESDRRMASYCYHNANS